MTYIADVFATLLGMLLSLCCQLLSNYSAGIVLFTFLIKIVLFPVLALGYQSIRFYPVDE